jgi:hypothetical protein
MKRTLTLFVLIFFVLDIYSCDCKTKKKLDVARQTQFENAEIVILGDVFFISSDYMKFQIRILETFKGELKPDQIIEGENHLYCEPNANSIGQWLIYGYIENGKLKTIICGLSRSLKSPEDNRYFWAPPPPPSNLIDSTYLTKKYQKKEAKKITKYKEIAKVEIQKEIELLRKRKK